MRKANYKRHFLVCALFESFLTRKKKLAMCEIIRVLFLPSWTGKKLMKEETKP